MIEGSYDIYGYKMVAGRRSAVHEHFGWVYDTELAREEAAWTRFALLRLSGEEVYAALVYVMGGSPDEPNSSGRRTVLARINGGKAWWE